MRAFGLFLIVLSAVAIVSGSAIRLVWGAETPTAVIVLVSFPLGLVGAYVWNGSGKSNPSGRDDDPRVSRWNGIGTPHRGPVRFIVRLMVGAVILALIIITAAHAFASDSAPGWGHFLVATLLRFVIPLNILVAFISGSVALAALRLVDDRDLPSSSRALLVFPIAIVISGVCDLFLYRYSMSGVADFVSVIVLALLSGGWAAHAAWLYRFAPRR
jgi:hypothetical protein